MDEAVFVDASPLIFLGNAGRLDLLQVFEPAVISIPQVVFDEVTAGGHRDRAAREILEASWLTRTPTPRATERVAAWDLGPGESAVIDAALDRGSRVVIDDLAGRRCARSMRLPLSGTVGVVILAARRGLVAEPLALFAELRAAGMWLSDAVIREAVSQATPGGGSGAGE